MNFGVIKIDKRIEEYARLRPEGHPNYFMEEGFVEGAWRVKL